MIDKWIWRLKQLTVRLDRRKIKVPAYLQGEHFLLFDYWYCNRIVFAEKLGSQFIFETRHCKYKVYAALLDAESRAIAQSLVQSRPVVWW